MLKFFLCRPSPVSCRAVFVECSATSVHMDAGYILIDEQSSLEELIKLISKRRADVREPLNLLNLDDVVAKHRNWQRKLPNVAPYYAVKCNSHPTVLKLLATLGCGFDCASRVELETIIDLGVAPARVIYANPAKPVESLQYAKKVGVRRMTFDSSDELEKIAKHFPEAELVLRIRHDAREAQLSLGRKFGCDPERDAVVLLTHARKLNLKVIGVSFHVGSGSMDAECFYDGIRKVLDIFDKGELLGMHMFLLDIGGGFPGANSRRFDDHAFYINKAIREHVMQFNRRIEVIAEPGRYYVESAVTAFVNVVSKSYERDTSGRIARVRYYMDDGLYDSFDWCDATQSNVPVVQEDKRTRECLRSVIYGQTACERDVISEEIFLPEHSVGECMVFPNKGAYGKILGIGHNGFVPARVKVCLSRATLNYLCASAVKAERG
ncbi:ornithine decarboxylase 1-like [Anopheles ziemanni]|uniref:ornithine decarboxylase 1-like n=1 Tax=Anopheles coustani TaxID=139045 RepID=UPI002658BDAC|nr:ornithine decarboxylase 1-like [Anopheles coustani]XP_058170694.1 ornithine decarboxylase 1-like [Anopheles ziemanni]